MFRRLMLLMTILLMLPAASLAENRPPYEVFTFSGSLPQRLKEPLSDLIPDESRILSGAAVQHNGSHYGTAPDYLDAYTAMVLVNTQQGLRLYAAAQVEGLPWQINDYTRFLRQAQNVSVSIYQPEPNRIPVFSVDYAAHSGMVSDLMLFRGNRLWQLTGHIDEGVGTTIFTTIGSTTVIDSQGRGMYSCTEPFWMDYLADASGFPTTREAVEILDKAAASTSVSNEAAGLGYTVGSHLRREATSKSESLGIYHAEVPLTLTGEEKPGTQLPWYQVRIGDTLGWMSANYIHRELHQNYPVPLGRTLDSCSFYTAAGDAQPLQQLEPGTTFHILTEYEGMYHICIPSGEISWDVDRQGLYGYIPTAGVLTGYSPPALDAQEKAK